MLVVMATLEARGSGPKACLGKVSYDLSNYILCLLLLENNNKGCHNNSNYTHNHV